MKKKKIPGDLLVNILHYEVESYGRPVQSVEYQPDKKLIVIRLK